mmetsp:Transcript_69869/g.102387  ORF Transcript_69869/g.102387 Transcript_69869/m.102387 type:complete len:133 (+) Transcript_69869:105-503(+)
MEMHQRGWISVGGCDFEPLPFTSAMLSKHAHSLLLPRVLVPARISCSSLSPSFPPSSLPSSLTPARLPAFSSLCVMLVSHSTPRDLATADLSDTYSTPMHLQPATLVQALARSSELEYNEAVDMQGFPDSFL